jgi:hypothetical protein
MLTRVLFALVLIGGTAAAFALALPISHEASADSSPGQEAAKLLAFGLTDHEVTAEELEKGTPLRAPGFNTPAMAYVWAANLKQGDVVEIALRSGEKLVVRNEVTLDGDKPKYLLLAGKRGVPPGGWPEGTYHAALKITRDGIPLINETTKPIELN